MRASDSINTAIAVLFLAAVATTAAYFITGFANHSRTTVTPKDSEAGYASLQQSILATSTAH